MSDPAATLEEFLHRHESGDHAEADPAARERVQHWLQAHPDAAWRLVSTAQSAHAELEAARRELTRQERARRMGLKAAPSQEELRRQSQAWDKLLGTTGGRSARAAARGAAASGTAPARALTFEDLGARFVHAHVGKLWLGLAVVAAVVVAWR
ncbi:MAG: hypothetical protein RI988_2556 [Pseudomonadota bacterium]|jgi:hypothetical protein